MHYHVHCMYGNGGGGHKASAVALKHLLDAAVLPAPHTLSVTLVDASAVAGATPGDHLYNLLLTYDLVPLIHLVHTALHTLLFPLVLPSLRNSFRHHFATAGPVHCLVSFVPMLNAVFAAALPPDVPLLTVLTDFSHTRTHPWIQHPRQHLVAGTDIALTQALAHGYAMPSAPSPSMRVTPTSGMVVHPKFYRKLSPSARRRKRVQLGLPQHLPTILLLFGGTPPTDRVLNLVELFLDRAPHNPVSLIAICANNRILFEKLSQLNRRDKLSHLHVTGFTTEIPLYMQLSDLLVGKPGPGVVSEALVSGLPCVLITGPTDNSVMKQERDVLDWVRRHRVGLIARSVHEAADISMSQISQLRARVAEMPPNHAVFEVRNLVLGSLGLPPVSEEPEDEDDEDEDDDDGDSKLEARDALKLSLKEGSLPCEEDQSNPLRTRARARDGGAT